MRKRRKRQFAAVWEGCGFLPLIEVHRSGKTVIYGCKAMSDFSEECLGFKTAEGQILLFGCSLRLLDYCNETAVVVGKILRIEWVDG